MFKSIGWGTLLTAEKSLFSEFAAGAYRRPCERARACVRAFL